MQNKKRIKELEEDIKRINRNTLLSFLWLLIPFFGWIILGISVVLMSVKKYKLIKELEKFKKLN